MPEYQQHTFFVHGTGPFPTDMLRYDECWPDGSGDALMVASSQLPRDHPDGLGTSRWKVRLRTCNRSAPTVARWQSFNASVLG